MPEHKGGARRRVPPKSMSTYNKLAFTGFRVFLLEPPNWELCPPGSDGILSYYDIGPGEYEQMTGRLGYHPSPEQFAIAFAKIKAKVRKIKYRAAFVNNERYELLWKAKWYAGPQNSRILSGKSG